MKKLMLVVLTANLLTSTIVHAQGARFGFSAGATLGQFRAKSDFDTYKSNSRIGFTLGIMTDVPMGGQFSFQPELNFLQKGGSDKQTDNGIETTYNLSLNYLELPLNFVFRSKGRSVHFIGGAGPSLSYGLSGREKASFDGQSSSSKLTFGNGDDADLKPFEFNANILAGLETSAGLSFTINYNIGLSNSSPDSQSSFKNNYWGLRVGYLLKHK